MTTANTRSIKVTGTVLYDVTVAVKESIRSGATVEILGGGEGHRAALREECEDESDGVFCGVNIDGREWSVTVATTAETITNKQIEALRREAALAEDTDMVCLCDIATSGFPSERAQNARALCADAIRQAKALAE